MYCGNCFGLGADVGGAFSPTGLKVLGLSPWTPPVLKTAPVSTKIPVSCPSVGITYYFDSQAQASAFRCPPGTAPAPGGGPPPVPATGGPTPGTDYNDPSTWPTGPTVAPPSPATQEQINSVPTGAGGGGGGGGTPLDTGAPVQAGMLGNVSPLMLALLVGGAFFIFRKKGR